MVGSENASIPYGAISEPNINADSTKLCGSKLLLTDNNYQSYQSFPNKK